jgi:PAT family beta-lactamase induction signal transducer AmpG
VLTGKAPEPAQETAPPASLRDALWYPFLGFLARPRALEILAFVFFYKLADNLAGALLRPFLVDMGFGDFDRGVALATVGLLGTIVGTFLGGVLTTAMGLGHALWVFGAVQIVSNIGYVLIARAGLDRALMYGATGFESLTSGLGTGAFAVLLLRLTERRFSATQYALFSSLFGLPRIVAGPLSGLAVDAVGWEPFFWSTMAAGIPGLVLLHRFSPLGVREPRVAPEDVHAAAPGRPLSRAGLAARGIAGGAVALLLGAVALGTLGAVKAARGALGRGVDPLAGLGALVAPADLGGWLQLAGLLVFALVAGLATAAVFAARGTRGAG